MCFKRGTLSFQLLMLELEGFPQPRVGSDLFKCLVVNTWISDGFSSHLLERNKQKPNKKPNQKKQTKKQVNQNYYTSIFLFLQLTTFTPGQGACT